MSELLTQEEVNALLQGVPFLDEVPVTPSWTEPPAVPGTRVGARDGKTAPYDFRRPNRVPRSLLQSLHVLHERHARNFALNLSAYLRTVADVALLSIDQLSYSEFLTGLPETTSINVVKIEPQGGTLAYEVNPSLVFAVIEKLMGGASETPAMNREITQIEQQLVEGFLQLSLRDLQEAWQTAVPTGFRLVRQETNPRLVRIAGADEIVVVITCEVRIGQSSGMMSFCIPAVYLEPFARTLERENHIDLAASPTAEVRARIDAVLARVPVNLSADLVEQRMAIRDLLSLRVGDVLPLERETSSPVTVRVAGIPKFLGALGSRRRRRAVRILSPVHRSPTGEPRELGGDFDVLAGPRRP
ncbi:MAG: flagellar motor switch protein FliM [Deferrisomatales bacterium]|nr:flagellar motor switch protein FliM [Deferrisomatales bacterium]